MSTTNIPDRATGMRMDPCQLKYFKAYLQWRAGRRRHPPAPATYELSIAEARDIEQYAEPLIADLRRMP